MKKTAFAALAAVLIFITNCAVFAAYDLSMGLDIIKSGVEVKKCGEINTATEFSEDDFDKIIGKAEYITLMTVPEKALGRLVLGGKEITAGQTITRRSLGGMRYIPKNNIAGTASFTFRNASSDKNGYGVCTLYILEEKNSAPTVNEMSFETSKNITLKGFLESHDPDGDALSFTIVSGARHGTVRLTHETSGHFMYTPKADFTGRDIFTFRARDCYGNQSGAVKVTVHVSDPESDTVFYDMTNHWAHNSAIEICSDGLMSFSESDGKKCFMPDGAVSRGDFLAIAMIAAGLEDSVMRSDAASFADADSIPQNIKSYAETAYALGIISGYPHSRGVSFESQNTITRKEASVIISRILALKKDAVSTVSEISAATSGTHGILVGTGFYEPSPDSPITRAQAAQIYCRIKDVCAENEKSNKAPENGGILSALIGFLSRKS